MKYNTIDEYFEKKLKQKEKINEARKQKRKENPRRYLWEKAKRNAVRNQREFNLSIEDITIPRYCPFLGIPLTIGSRKGSPSNASIDRIDNTKGYIKGNVEIISNLANIMKSSATPEQLVSFAKVILERYS